MTDSEDPIFEASGEADPELARWVAALAERLLEGDPIEFDALSAADSELAEELARILPTIQRMVSFGKAPAESRGATHRGDRETRVTELGTLGDFRLLRELGRGGMGIVYEAEQLSLQRRVALKILPLAAALDQRQYQRFLIEARASACLHHTNIVPVYAVGSERGVPYYAMQFIDGLTLAQALEEVRDRALEGAPALEGAGVSTSNERAHAASSLGPSSRDRCHIRAVTEHGRSAAEALDHAHSRGVLHRDIKPANLMLDADGHLWITDFGLAQIQGDSRLTITGDILGTLRYMSPEQALAKRVVIDGRTDVYSLGATLYELLALRPAFDGADRAEVLRKIAHEDPKPLRSLNPAVPRDLETIIHKTLAKEPSDRYATARELANDLGRCLDSRPIVARPPRRLELAAKWVRRNRAVVIPVAFSAAVSLAALAGGLIWSNDWLRQHNEQLRIESNRAERLSLQLAAQRDLAERRRLEADRHLYAFRLRQAAEAWRAKHFEDAQEILRECRPEPGEAEFREFAWRHLWKESRRQVAVLSDRDERVASIALSSDGRRLASGDRDGHIRIRDTESGELLTSFRSESFSIAALAFSPDGSRLASGTFDPEAGVDSRRCEFLLWDLAASRVSARLDGVDSGSFGELRFDLSNSMLWEHSYREHRHLVRAWALEGDASRRPRLVISRPSCERLTISADGERFVGHSPDRQVVEVRNRRDERLFALPRWASGYDAVALSADGRLVAVAAREGFSEHNDAITVWDVDSGRPIGKPIPGPWRWTAQLQFSDDGRSLAAVSGQGVLLHLEIASGDFWVLDRDMRDGGDSSGSLCFLPGDRGLAWSYFGRKTGARPLRIVDRIQGSTVAQYPGRASFCDELTRHPSKPTLAMISKDRAILWNHDPEADQQPEGHTDEAWAATFSSDGLLLATGSDNTDETLRIKLWETATGRLIRGWSAHDTTTSALAFHPRFRLLASAGLSSANNLRLWDTETGALAATLHGHTDKVRSVAFSPDGTLLASAGSDGTVRIWDVASRSALRRLDGHAGTVRAVVFNRRGDRLASGGTDGTVRIWEASTGKEVRREVGRSGVAAVAFAPDDRTLAWAAEDGVVELQDLEQGRPLPPLHIEDGELRAVAWAPDGRTLAAAGKSGRVFLWDPATGQELLTLEGTGVQANAVVFSPDGSMLAVCRHDGSVRLYRSHRINGAKLE